ncbi:MAG: hypothetical protein JJU02_07580 [Cryomorphaceae bacterium]|nr:hypothetical protein [Cryomorphaceae bacterium]
MKKLIFALIIGVFGFGTAFALPTHTLQQKERKMQKEVIGTDELPENIRERINQRGLEVTEVFVLKNTEGQVRFFKVKGTVDGENRVWKFDEDGNRMTMNRKGKRGKGQRGGEYKRKQFQHRK